LTGFGTICYLNCMFTPSQSRAARGLLHWTQADLAEKAGVGLSGVRDFETERREVSADLQAAIRSALETAGVDMIPTNGGGPGVRLRAPD
jgi:transcriptional regulator with XRE-family HTH domain